MQPLIIPQGQAVLVQDSENKNAYISVGYEDLAKLAELVKANKKIRTPKKSYSLTDAGYVGKRLSLTIHAVMTGKWSSGSPIDTKIAFDRLISFMGNLTAKDYSEISPKVKGKVERLLKHLESNPQAHSRLLLMIETLEANALEI